MARTNCTPLSLWSMNHPIQCNKPGFTPSSFKLLVFSVLLLFSFFILSKSKVKAQTTGTFNKVGIGTYTPSSSFRLHISDYNSPNILLERTADSTFQSDMPSITFKSNTHNAYFSFAGTRKLSDTLKELWIMSNYENFRRAKARLRIFGTNLSESNGLMNSLDLSYDTYKYGGVINIQGNQSLDETYKLLTLMPSGGRVSVGPRRPIRSRMHIRGFPHNADYTFSVDGCGVFRQILVIGENDWYWPDYVFQPDYCLKPLAEVDAYIKTNKHLPDVPSAATVAEAGQDLGEMNKILLRKIEELTLYIIQQEQRISNLETK